jgi:predicted negative regulator of RcsB-dependent stress response
VDIHRTEEEQLEALRAWWRENGRSAIFGVVLGLGAIFGYRYWQAREIAAAEAASTGYQEVLVAMQQPGSDGIRKQAEALAEKHPGGSYGVFAGMVLAMTAVDSGDLDKAAALLEAARKENKDKVIDLELRLRLAQVRNAQGRHDDAIAMLDVQAGKEYAAGFDELRGDIEARRGNADQARGAYERALAAHRASGTDAAMLELKLDNLGRSDKS